MPKLDEMYPGYDTFDDIPTDILLSGFNAASRVLNNAQHFPDADFDLLEHKATRTSIALARRLVFVD